MWHSCLRTTGSWASDWAELLSRIRDTNRWWEHKKSRIFWSCTLCLTNCGYFTAALKWGAANWRCTRGFDAFCTELRWMKSLLSPPVDTDLPPVGCQEVCGSSLRLYSWSSIKNISVWVGVELASLVLRFGRRVFPKMKRVKVNIDMSRFSGAEYCV